MKIQENEAKLLLFELGQRLLSVFGGVSFYVQNFESLDRVRRIFLSSSTIRMGLLFVGISFLFSQGEGDLHRFRAFGS